MEKGILSVLAEDDPQNKVNHFLWCPPYFAQFKSASDFLICDLNERILLDTIYSSFLKISTLNKLPYYNTIMFRVVSLLLLLISQVQSKGLYMLCSSHFAHTNSNLCSESSCFRVDVQSKFHHTCDHGIAHHFCRGRW